MQEMATHSPSIVLKTLIEGVIFICYTHHRRGVAQPGSAPAWGAGGRWFESNRPDHLFKHKVVLCRLLDVSHA